MQPERADRRERPILLPLAAFLLLTTVWGSSFFFTELALASFGYVQVAFLRVVLGCIVLGVVVLAMRLPLPRSARIHGHFMVLGVVSIGIPFLLVTAAQQHMDSSLAVILVSTTPIFVFIITTALGRSKLSVPTAIGIGVSFAGVSSLYLGNGLAGLANSGGWPLAVIACALFFAIGNVYTRHFLSFVHPIVLAFLQLTAALVPMTPYFLLTEGFPTRAPEPLALIGIIELGVLGSALAYVLFSYLIQTVGSTATSVNTYLQPVVGVILGVVVLGEVISGRSWVSIAVILLGVAVFAVGSWRQFKRARASAVTNY